MLFEQIKKDQLTARKNKESDKALWLSTLIGELQRGEKDFSDAKVLGLIKKNLENLRENLKHNPNSESAQNEIAFLEAYLPQQMSETEIQTAVQKLIAEGATNMKMVMTGLQTQYTGLYDGKLASKLVKDALG
ncbi:MAG: GatB/YqeY domain-containing protein [Candidatus Sericytochromatia bacterium]|nr:GatB/YqeY domain-containing protein [Candidatus Sericytochromatia bacterium]